jgi:hypothetical protein
VRERPACSGWPSGATTPRPRWQGSKATRAGSALLVLLGLQLDTAYSAIWWVFALFGAGLGLITAPIAAAAVAGMPQAQAGLASAVLNTSRQVGGAVSIALLGAVFGSRFRAALPPVLRAHAGAASGGFQATEPASRRLIDSAFISGLHAGYLVAGIALLASTLLALGLLGALRPRRAVSPPASEPERAGTGSKRRSRTGAGTSSTPTPASRCSPTRSSRNRTVPRQP